jgi:hypothetical protein
MVLVPVGSGTAISASDTQHDTQSAIGDAWKGAFDKAQSERSGSSVNPTTIAGTPSADVILPTPGLGPQLTVPAPPDLGPLINVPAPRDFGPLINVPAPPAQGPLINVPAPRDFGPLINVPAPPAQGPLINVPAQQGPYVNYAKGIGKKPKQGKVEVTPLEKKSGRLEGDPEPENGNRAIKRQNESAKILSEHDGLWVKQLPNGKNPEGEKNPDLEISTNQGKSWQKGDVKSPTSDKTQNIRQDIEDARKQGTVAVVNLDDTKVSAGQVILNLKNNPIQGLNDIYVIKGDTVTRVSYGK